jgi:hypothetical protein
MLEIVGAAFLQVPALRPAVGTDRVELLDSGWTVRVGALASALRDVPYTVRQPLAAGIRNEYLLHPPREPTHRARMNVIRFLGHKPVVRHQPNLRGPVPNRQQLAEHRPTLITDATDT